MKKRSKVVRMKVPAGRDSSDFFAYSLADDSLEDIGINQGDLMVFDRQFNEKKISLKTPCIIGTGDIEDPNSYIIIRRLKFLSGGRVALIGGDGGELYRHQFRLLGAYVSYADPEYAEPKAIQV